MRNCYTLKTKIVELFLILRIVFSFYTVVALQFKDEDCLSKVFTLVISHSNSNLFKVFIIYFTKLLLLWSRLSFFHPLCLWFVVLQELLCSPPPCVTKPLQYFINWCSAALHMKDVIRKYITLISSYRVGGPHVLPYACIFLFNLIKFLHLSK